MQNPVFGIRNRQPDYVPDFGTITSRSASIANIFLFGKEAKEIGEGAKESGFPSNRIFFNNDISAPQITADQIRKVCQSEEVLLMKASRKVQLERVLDMFTAL